MKIRKDILRYSRRILECLAVLLLLGATALAAAKTGDDVASYASVDSEDGADNAIYTTKDGTWVRVSENTWTMDTNRDGKTDITLVKNGDEWEYLFQVADPDADYYGWENEVPEGYQIVGKGERKNPAVQFSSPKYSHTPNINDEGKQNGNYSNNYTKTEVVTMPGASKLHVVLNYEGESVNCDWVCMWEGNHSDYTAYNNSSSAIKINNTQKFGGASGKVECDVDGDSVTFAFRSDGSGVGNGYGYYAVVTSDNKPDFTITNEQTDYQEPEYGSLTLSKEVTGTAADTDQNFRFDITLSSDEEELAKKLAGNTTFGNVNFTDGKGMVYLKHGESMELKDIPVGINWQIKETAVDGYTTSMTVDGAASGTGNTVEGTIDTKDHNTVVHYTNHKDKPDSGDTPQTPTGTFAVKKVVQNGSDTDEFGFAAVLTGLEAQKSYEVQNEHADGTTDTFTLYANAAGTAYLEFTLKNGEIARFQNLPVGSKYQIKEDASDYTASYEITDEADASKLQTVMSKKENYESNQSLSTQNETLDKEEQALITFTNSKPAPKPDLVDIAVEKTWNDDNNKKNLRPSEITVRLYQSTSDSEEGDMVATAKLDEAGDWKTTFKDLDKYQPNSTDVYIYTVKEDPVSGYESAVTSDGKGTYTLVNTLSTEKTGDLKVSKTVTGIGADKKKEFRFKITVKKKDNTALQGSFVLDSESGKGTKTGSIYFDENGEGSISLKDGESAYITGLPEATTYSVEETKYTDWKSSLTDGTKNTGTIAEDQLSEVKVQNTYEGNRTLTVKKTVKGSMGDKSKEFTFRLTLTAPEGRTLPDPLIYEKDGTEGTLAGTNGEYTFTLAHGETILLKDIPCGSTYELTEPDAAGDGYTVTADGKEKASLSEDTTVTFTNEKNGTIPTLAAMNTWLAAALVVLAAIALGAIVWKRKS